MRTVSLGDLNRLSDYLQYVRNGEEVVIRDGVVPVARILPFAPGSGWERESQLVVSGAMRMPEQDMDWIKFFEKPTGTISYETALQAVCDSRGDR